MTAPFSNPSSLGGGGFFKPKPNMTALAILVEPKSIEHNVPNSYNGATTLRDVVIADVTVWESQRDMESGEPTEHKAVKIDKKGLTRPLEQIMGGAMVGTVDMQQGEKGAAYVWRDVPAGDVLDAVTKYYSDREAAVAADVDDAPEI